MKAKLYKNIFFKGIYLVLNHLLDYGKVFVTPRCPSRA